MSWPESNRLNLGRRVAAVIAWVLCLTQIAFPPPEWVCREGA